MKVSHHIAISSVLAGGLWAASGSVVLSAASLVTGVLIDLDHAVDYVVNHGITLNPRRFLTTFYQGRIDRVVIFFHAWEWIAVLGAAAFLSRGNPLILGIGIGAAVHLACDQVFNRTHPLGYFLCFRIATRFRYRRSFPCGGIDSVAPRS